MVLNEAPSEKIRHTWYSRLAQERRELSASVDETLSNTPLDESFWLDDASQSATTIGTEQRNNVFPPRLSLQSRSLPGTSASTGKGLMSIHRDTERRPNIWIRFVRRLTSWLMAFCFHPAVVATPPLPLDDGSTPPAQVKDVIPSSEEKRDSSDIRVLSTTTSEVTSKSECRVATSTNIRRGSPHLLHSTQGRYRLAGRTTRIRLEVVPGPSSLAVSEREKDSLEPKRMPGTLSKDHTAREYVLANTRRPAVSAFHSHNDVTCIPVARSDGSVFSNEGGTSVRLPAVEKVIRRPVVDRAFVDDDGGTTSIRLPVIEKVARGSKRALDDRALADGNGGATSLRLPVVEKVARRREGIASGWHAGTGMFECGQRDITVADPFVTASSVVLVTLTANPGPVVVQYVSLQPQTGFTIHLTAPTTMGAPFNYIVLGF